MSEPGRIRISRKYRGAMPAAVSKPDRRATKPACARAYLPAPAFPGRWDCGCRPCCRPLPRPALGPVVGSAQRTSATPTPTPPAPVFPDRPCALATGGGAHFRGASKCQDSQRRKEPVPVQGPRPSSLQSRRQPGRILKPHQHPYAGGALPEGRGRCGCASAADTLREAGHVRWICGYAQASSPAGDLSHPNARLSPAQRNPWRHPRGAGWHGACPAPARCATLANTTPTAAACHLA